MTIANTATKKEKSKLQFAVTGSQINLSPRPQAPTNLCCSYRNYPMRRSISAFGFQSKGDYHSNTSSRPLSADNIRYSNKKVFNATFTLDNKPNVSISTEDCKECILSENEFDNIINGYSESKQMHPSHNTDLKPGLSSKPPLPFIVETRSNTSKPITQQYSPNESQSVSKQDAFDEIIALKFQRWFPDAIVGASIDGSSSDNDDNLELLSYRKRQFQSCEYRYEITQKNMPSKQLATDKTSRNQSACKTMKTKSKKVNSKLKNKIFTTHTCLDGHNKNVMKQEDNNPQIEEEALDEYNAPKPLPQIILSPRDHSDSIVHDNDPLQWLEEQDLRLLQAKEINNSASNDSMEELEHKPKIMKNNYSKTEHMNSSAKCNGVQKKPKKITFQVDQNKTERESKKDMEANVENKNGVGRFSFATENELRTRNDFDQKGPSAYPPQPSQLEDDVLLSKANTRLITPCSNLTTPDSERSGSMFEEIVDILKDIEAENIGNNQHSDLPEISDRDQAASSAKAIWSLIEEAERTHNVDELSTRSPRPTGLSSENLYNSRSSPPNTDEPKNRNRLSDLLRYPTSELAQKVMTLQMLLDEKECAIQNINSRFKGNEQMFKQEKEHLQCSINKLNRLIEQLKVEKKTAIEKLQANIKEVERKENSAIQNLEEKYKVDLKRNLEKHAAADKMEREKWMEIQSKLIKDKALKSLEPELNRMAAAHEETVSDIHKFYKRQITELEETLNRRMAVQKEKLEAEKEKALAIEREISRQKLEDEIAELEKRYQDQRKRLLAEVHVEREHLERTNEASIAIKEKENERKWTIKSDEMQKRIEALQSQHQDEIVKLQQSLEAEKQFWIKNQAMELLEKENRIREQYKKERDKHIEQVIQKLETENSQRELLSEQKIKRLKEQYETEIHDFETSNENLRRKLNDSRIEIQKGEEVISQLRAQVNQSNTEYVILKEKYDRLVSEQGEIQNIAKSELSTKLHILQSEHNQTHLTYESKIKSMKSEHERELSEMYNRVREMIIKKDDLINSLKMQKDVALDQCNQLEKLLDLKRSNSSFY